MNVLRQVYRGENEFDFIRVRKWGYLLSLALMVAGGISLLTRGLDYGIEFDGGVSWQVEANDVSVSDARDALADVDLRDAKVQLLGGRTLRVQAGEEAIAREDEVTERLAELAGVPPEQVSVNEVGPTWGDEISSKAQRALVYFLVAVALYISFRFEWRMAVAALAAVAHDILITVGIYSIFGFEVTPATVIAFLTILGFSLYDTIVVFDKVQENANLAGVGGRMTFSSVVNLSMNETLMRSINTSVTSLLPIISILLVGSQLLGAVTLQEFAIALLVGLGVGAYSSIFIASPILASLKEREPKYRAARRRAEAAGLERPERPVLTPSADREPDVQSEEPPAPRPVTPSPYRQGPPRGRKRRRRR